MSTPKLFSLNAPLGGEITAHYHDFGPSTRSPRLALVAGFYGNELNGVFILSRLADFLKRIEAKEQPEKQLRERVLIIPAVNTLNLNSHARDWPIDKDRDTPLSGYLDSDIAQQIADAVLQVTRQAYYRINIRTSNLDVEEMPQVWLYEPNDDERASACLFGLPAIVEHPRESMTPSSLDSAWRDSGGENFAIEDGQAGYLHTPHCETLFRALIAFLDRTGIVTGLTLSEEEENLRYFGLNQTFAIVCEEAGFFVSRLEVGRWVYGGDHIGYIYDSFTGAVRAEIRAPVSGLLSSLRRHPILFEGDLIARILISGDTNITQDQIAQHWSQTLL
jgi:predicted deacylase